MQVVRAHHLLFQRGAGRDDLEGGARLVQILDGAVAAPGVGGLAEGVRVERRVAGKSQQLARERIHHHGGCTGRAAPLHALPQLALDDVLHLLVDGQLERGAGRGLPLGAAEGATLGVHVDEDGAGPALDRRVVGGLDAAQPDVVDAHVPEHVRGQRLVGVEARFSFRNPTPPSSQLGHAPRLLGRHLPANVDERLALADAVGQRGAILGRAVVQGTAQARRRP